MRIDAHQHFWKYDAVRDHWMTEEMSVLRKDYLPHDLYPELKSNGIDGCISIQADQSENETFFLNELAAKHDWIRGVVGWIDLQSNRVEERLEFFSSFEKIKGWRHIVQSEAPGFMLDAAFLQGIRLLSRFDFTYDILIYPNQIADAIEVVRKFTNQKFIINHLGKPAIKAGQFDSWSRDIKSLSEFPNVSCKVSGMVTEADWNSWHAMELIPFIDVVVANFGTRRLLYGSDWPVCLLAGTYRAQLSVYEKYFSDFSKHEQADIFGRNALRLYGVDDGH